MEIIHLWTLANIVVVAGTVTTVFAVTVNVLIDVARAVDCTVATLVCVVVTVTLLNTALGVAVKVIVVVLVGESQVVMASLLNAIMSKQDLLDATGRAEHDAACGPQLATGRCVEVWTDDGKSVEARLDDLLVFWLHRP